MKFLVIAGHISYDARRYEHLIDLYDHLFIKNIILTVAEKDDKIDVVCSPNCFDPLNKEKRISYKMVTENDDLMAKWVEKNIYNYDFIFALSDAYSKLKDNAITKVKPCIMFNTLSVTNRLNWPDFVSLNEHSRQMVNATCGVTRFLEEPNRYFITHQDGSRFECFGSESIGHYICCLLSKNKYSISIAQIREMPTLKQTLMYDEVMKEISDLGITWIDIKKIRIAMYDNEARRYLVSFDKDNETFSLVSGAEYGTETGKVEVSHTVPEQYFKMTQIMKLRPGFDFCVFIPSHYNFLNAVYVLPNFPERYFATKKEILSVLEEVFFSRDYDLQKTYLVYEEGRGYYLIGKSIKNISMFLKEQKLVTANAMPVFYRDNQKNLEHIQKNLSDKFWSHFRSKIGINDSDKVLDMDAINDIVCTKFPKAQVYQHNKFSEFDERSYIGKLHPVIKYDHIIYAGTYYTMALAHNEVERYWDWLYSLLTPTGQVHIIGQDIIEPLGRSDLQLMVGESITGAYQVLFNEIASGTTRRMALFDGKILSYFNPLDTTSMNIITKKFGYIRIPYSKKSEIYIHSFNKLKGSDLL